MHVEQVRRKADNCNVRDDRVRDQLQKVVQQRGRDRKRVGISSRFV